MREIILAGAFALSTATCLAQTNQPSQQVPSEATSGAGQPAASQQGAANLCRDLLGFMKAPPPEAAGAPAAAKPAMAEKQAAPAKPASDQQGSSTSAGTSAADKNASGDSATGSAQAVTGQDGVATDAPDPAKDKAASGSVANAPQKESRAAPVPPADVTSTPKEAVLTIDAAQKLADANDIAQCQKAAREMRVAGVAMPPPLIALAALDLQYQQKSGAAAAPAGSAADQ
ncbi:hypothetical protein [Manganibacter manganicus]|uniref:Uncharacterized protein n=1 Tax=Manganibacter manganicus TaxID=1873176 RepID=A0A1V8RL24_9HYPH|nr:hypothetical protein [Pseudaminobacter manganicus]OQM73901.1 hypothetical protein BFN67_06080 [Pseudaminobacter manganicus]